MPSPESDLIRSDEREKERLEILKDERKRYKICKNCGQIIRRYINTHGYTGYSHLHNDNVLCNTNHAEPLED